MLYEGIEKELNNIISSRGIWLKQFEKLYTYNTINHSQLQDDSEKGRKEAEQELKLVLPDITNQKGDKNETEWISSYRDSGYYFNLAFSGNMLSGKQSIKFHTRNDCCGLGTDRTLFYK